MLNENDPLHSILSMDFALRLCTSTVSETQLGSRCSDTCLALFQCCLEWFFGGIVQMSTLFLQLTQVLMSKIVAARKISTLDELKQNDDVHNI